MKQAPAVKEVKENIVDGVNEGGTIQGAIVTEQLPSRMPDIKVVTDGQYRPEITGGNLYLSVEGPSPEVLLSLPTKKLAYESRYKYGFNQAGIEVIDPPFPVNEAGDIVLDTSKSKSKLRYVIRFKLRPSIT